MQWTPLKEISRPLRAVHAWKASITAVVFRGPCARQIRPTVAALTPTAVARVRVLQWVSAAGFSWVVRRTTSSIVGVRMRAGRPERGRSSRPSIWAAAKRSRQRPTVCRHNPNSPAICWFSRPTAARKMMRARSTQRAGNVRLRANRSKSSRTSWLNHTLGAHRIMTEPECRETPRAPVQTRLPDLLRFVQRCRYKTSDALH
jgi:hypothetical protein